MGVATPFFMSSKPQSYQGVSGYKQMIFPYRGRSGVLGHPPPSRYGKNGL